MGLHEDSSPTGPATSPTARRLPAARSTAAPYAKRTRSYYQSLQSSSVGLEFAVAVIIGLFGGMWLDKHFGTSPWLMLVCLGFGFTAAMRGVWRHVADADRAAKESEGT